MTTAGLTKRCPECDEPVVEISGYATWCAACEWGLPAQEKAGGRLRERAARWSARRVQSLYEQVAASPAARPGWSVARVASYALAVVIYTCFLGLIAAAGLLLAMALNVMTIGLAAVALLFAFEIRPRLGSMRKLRKRTPVRYRDDAPVLFDLLDRVADEVGAKPVYAVIPSAQWNAGYLTVGIMRRRVLKLGLPLWEALPPDEKLAILGHEFAHGVNGDARHGTVVGTSVATLARLYDLLQPVPQIQRRPQRYAAYEQLAKLMMLALSSIVLAVLKLQNLISLLAGQRAEYYADRLAAQLASPASAADALDTLLTGADTFRFTVGRQRFRDDQSDFWNELRIRLEAVPESEKERRRRVAMRKPPRVNQTHPPMHLRIAVLRGLPPGPSSASPALSLTDAEHEKIRAELAADYDRVARQIRDSVQVAR